MFEPPRLYSLKEAAKLPREQLTASAYYEAGRERRLYVVRLGGRTDGYAGGAHSAEVKNAEIKQGNPTAVPQGQGIRAQASPRSLPKAG